MARRGHIEEIMRIRSAVTIIVFMLLLMFSDAFDCKRTVKGALRVGGGVDDLRAWACAKVLM
jgi:hypothetical protein